MIRKHTRRAAKAAFAIALGVADHPRRSTAARRRAAGKGRRRRSSIGTKNFTEAVRPRPALQAGARGQGLQGRLQGEHRLDGADRQGADERQDHDVPRVHRRIACSVTFKKKTFAEVGAGDLRDRRRSSTRRSGLHARSSRRRSRTSTRSPCCSTTAKKYGLKTVADLKKVPEPDARPRSPSSSTRQTGLLGMKQVYGVTERQVHAARGDQRVQAARRGQGARRPASSRRTRRSRRRSTSSLKDPKNIFGFQNVAPIVSKKLVSEYGPKLVSTLNAVSAKLTLEAMLAMNTAVDVDKKPAAQSPTRS